MNKTDADDSDRDFAGSEGRQGPGFDIRLYSSSLHSFVGTAAAAQKTASKFCMEVFLGHVTNWVFLMT